MLIRRSIQSKARIGAFSIISVLIIAYYNGANAMTLDRLSTNYNDIQENDKSQYLQHNKIGGQSVVYDNIEYLPVKQNDKSDMYVLATSDKNDDNFSSDIKDVTVKQDDMLMLESHDNPLIEMLQLPATTRNNGTQSLMEENEMIHQINEPPAIHYNSEQLSETSEEMVTEVIKKMQQEMKSENEKKAPLANEELYDSQTLENEKNTQTQESLDIPMIGVVQEGEIPHESVKEQDTPFKESEITHENNENESYSLLDNQSQENSKPADWQEVQKLMDKVKEDISNIEDYVSNEEELPEECGDEYYMNPNQDSNAKDSTSQEFAIKPDMELQSAPSHNENEMFEETQNQQKPKEDITNLDNGLSGESENIMDLPSAETQSTAFADNHNIHNIYEPLEPIIMSAPPFDISQEEQGTNKPLQLETKINAINGLAEKENNTLLTTIIEMPQTSITENPAIVTTSEETFNEDDFKEILATTMNPNFEIITTSQQVQQQQQQPILIEKDIVKEGEIETVYNSQLRRYDGAQVWRIVVQNDKERRLADELHIKYGGQLWKEIKQEVDYLLKPQVLVEAEQYVRAANLSRIVLIDNLQKVIEVENPPAEQIAQLQNRKGHRLTWQAYHRLEDIHGFFDYLAKTYPDICSVDIIGYSIEKRPLKILKISNGQANNTGIWMDGGIHAREWISPAVVTYVANHLVEGWDDLPPYMRNINWYIHAVVNPDGYEYSHTTDRLWRKNMRSHGRLCPGVDLNRNFGYMWGGRGTSANPCSQIYRGTKAFSEPEAFYISKFISGFPKETFKAYLSFHSYGQYILYPWGYDYLETNDTMDLDLLARQAGTSIAKSTGIKYTVGSAANTLYPAAGGSDDWAKGIAEIKYSYTIEMGDTGRYGFVLPASQIECNGKDAYTVVETISRGITMGKNGRRRKLKLRRS